MVARAFIDDSGSGGDSRYYVLAGFRATIPTWESFADKWRLALDQHPPIGYFKMSEAESRKGQFDGFDEEQRDKKVSDLIDLIEQHDLWAGCCAVSQGDYDAIIKQVVVDRYDSPYLFAFGYLVAVFAGHEHHHGTTSPSSIWLPSLKPPGHAKIDFVFDRQDRERPARRLYERLRNVEPFNEIIENIDYRDDKIFLPLQAADLAAWQYRRRLCAFGEGTRPEYVRIYGKPLRSYRLMLGRSELLTVFNLLQEQAARRSRDKLNHVRAMKLIASDPIILRVNAYGKTVIGFCEEGLTGTTVYKNSRRSTWIGFANNWPGILGVFGFCIHGRSERGLTVGPTVKEADTLRTRLGVRHSLLPEYEAIWDLSYRCRQYAYGHGLGRDECCSQQQWHDDSSDATSRLLLACFPPPLPFPGLLVNLSFWY